MKVRTVVRMSASAAILAGGLAIGAGNGTLTSTAVLAAPSSCANYQLTMKPLSTNGAAGHISEMFQIHDLMPGSCTLYGYPGAMLLNTTFHSLPTYVTRAPFPEGGPGPRSVTLTRSHNAYFVAGWEHFPTPGQTCPSAGYIMVTAPNNRLPVVTYAGSEGGIDACGGKLSVSPVSAKRFW